MDSVFVWITDLILIEDTRPLLNNKDMHIGWWGMLGSVLIDWTWRLPKRLWLPPQCLPACILCQCVLEEELDLPTRFEVNVHCFERAVLRHTPRLPLVGGDHHARPCDDELVTVQDPYKSWLVGSGELLPLRLRCNIHDHNFQCFTKEIWSSRLLKSSYVWKWS